MGLKQKAMIARRTENEEYGQDRQANGK